MDQPNVLRTTKIGNGFVKEDVLQYIDSLNSENLALQEQLKELEAGAGGAGLDKAKEQQYEKEISRLRGELGTTKKQLRAAQEELSKRPVVSGGEGGASSEDLAAAQQSVQEMEGKLTDAKADLDAAQAQLQLAQNETNELQAKVKSLQEENASLQSDLAEASVQALNAQNNPETAQKLAELGEQLRNAQEETASLKAQLEAKDAQIQEQAGKSNEADLKKLAEYEGMISEMSSAAAEKDRQIETLQQKVTDLEESSGDSMDMSAIFMEAQTTAKKLKSEARKEADKRVADAKAEAEKLVSDAQATADKTIADANAQAEKKINDADAKAIQTIAEAEESVRASKEEAERRQKNTAETAKTVRSLLNGEIDAVEQKIGDISKVLATLTEQADDRVKEAKDVIAKTRESIKDTDDLPNLDDLESGSAQNGDGWN